MKYKYIILVIFLIVTGCSKDSNLTVKMVNPSQLIEDTDLVEEYTDTQVKPALKNITDETIESYLKIVNVLMDVNKGISVNKIAPFDFIKLSIVSRKNIVKKDAWYLFILPDEHKEMIRQLHNKYMLDDASGIFFGPTANDIVKYKFAFGCTHYARVFMAVVKSLKLVDDSENMRYVVACESESYNNFLKDNKKKIINGHQFVIVKINYKWYGINTNRKDDYIVFPKDFNPDMNLKKNNYPVSFTKIPGKIFLLRKIGKDYNDSCGDYSLDRLKNIYISGDPEDNKMQWGAYIK